MMKNLFTSRDKHNYIKGKRKRWKKRRGEGSKVCTETKREKTTILYFTSASNVQTHLRKFGFNTHNSCSGGQTFS